MRTVQKSCKWTARPRSRRTDTSVQRKQITESVLHFLQNRRTESFGPSSRDYVPWAHWRYTDTHTHTLTHRLNSRLHIKIFATSKRLGDSPKKHSAYMFRLPDSSHIDKHIPLEDGSANLTSACANSQWVLFLERLSSCSASTIKAPLATRNSMMSGLTSSEVLWDDKDNLSENFSTLWAFIHLLSHT